MPDYLKIAYDFLKDHDTPCESANWRTNSPLSATEPPAPAMVRVRSRLLGCDVIGIEDAYTGPVPAGLVVFTRSELERLRGMDAGAIAAVYETKAAFGGTYTGPSPARPDHDSPAIREACPATCD